MIQRFGKVDPEANWWPAAEIEYMDVPTGTSSYEWGIVNAGDVLAMNVMGQVRPIAKRDITSDFRPENRSSLVCDTLLISRTYMQNSLIHWWRTNDISVLWYTLKLPFSWMKLNDQRFQVQEEIVRILATWTTTYEIHTIRNAIQAVVLNHIYLLGSVKVEFLSDRDLDRYLCWQIMMTPTDGDWRSRQPYTDPRQGALVYDDWARAQQRCTQLREENRHFGFKPYDSGLRPTIDGLHNLYKR